jgi:hypothetical protein
MGNGMKMDQRVKTRFLIITAFIASTLEKEFTPTLQHFWIIS